MNLTPVAQEPPGTSSGVAEADTESLSDLAARYFWPHAKRASALSPTELPLVTRGRGVWVYDGDGHKYFDSLSGMWLTNVGHGRTEIAEAAYRQMTELAYAPDGTVNPTTVRLAARVARLAPDPESRVFFVSGGSEGVETAMKMARKYHRNRGEAGRYKFISRRGSYHGATLACLALGGGGANNGKDYGPLPGGAVRVQGPDQYRSPFARLNGRADVEAAREIERAILNEGPGTVAAVIGEPISASSGVHIPHPDYWPTVRRICDRYGVLLICDEVITGFGRTGKMFATEHWDVVPDITVVAKALTSGYVPIGAAIATKQVADAFDGGPGRYFDHRFTFGGNPVACAAAMANLDLVEDEGLVANAARLGDSLFDHLQSLRRHRIVGQVRGGLGLIAAVEIVQDQGTKQHFPAAAEMSKRATALMARHGLLGRGGDIFYLAPPLCATRSDIDYLVSQLDAVVTDLESELHVSGRAA